MDIKQALDFAGKKLSTARIEFSRLESEILLSEALGERREYILSYPERKLSIAQIIAFKRYLLKRSKDIPLAYITKSKEFYGYDFYVSKNVLIPRPETELMVDEALHILDKTKNKTMVIDIGTGSGCIIISLLKCLLHKKADINNYEFRAVDISRKALRIARKNAKSHHLEKYIGFSRSDLLSGLIDSRERQKENQDILILANLPYLSPNQIKNSPTIKYEPRLALAAGIDGLACCRRLLTRIGRLAQIPDYRQREVPTLKNQPQITALLEIDSTQAGKMGAIIKDELPDFKYQIKKDLNGLDRFLIIKN